MGEYHSGHACLSIPALSIDSKPTRVGKGDWCPYVCGVGDADGKTGYMAEETSIVDTCGVKLPREGKLAIIACMYKEDAPDLT